MKLRTAKALTAMIALGGAALCGNTMGALVAHWTGDGVTTDASGNGHDATAFGNTSYVSGVFGQAFDFDGSGDYLNVAHHSDFNFGTGDFSVSFWVRFDTAATNTSGVVAKDNFDQPSNSNYEGWLFNVSDAQGGFGFEVRDEPIQDTNARWDGYATSTWYHMTGVRKNNESRFYVNGVLEDTEAETGGGINVNTLVDLRIGALRPGAQFLNGQVDDVAIFSHALEVEDIESIRDDGVSGFLAVPEPGRGVLAMVGIVAISLRRRR